MLQGWPESQSTAQKLPLPEIDIQTAPRDGTLMSSSRQRTSQACDKCRERKTKCSGDRPVCKRCTTRGLICAYSCREPRSRGPARPRPRTVSAIELPSVTMSHSFYSPIYRDAEMQGRTIRQQHYRMASLPHPQQGGLQARVHPAKPDVLTDASVLTGSPSRQHMSHDFGQVRAQSKRFEPSMFSPTRPPMMRDAGQIKPLGKVEGPVNFCVPIGGGGFTMARNAPMTPMTSSFALKPKSAGVMGYLGRSSPPSLTHSTSTSVTHSPSSSEHSLEAHYQSITNLELLMASYADATLYEHPSDAVFGSLEPPATIEPCFKQGTSTEVDPGRRDASLELLSPTPITPIGMENLETVLDTPAFGK